jgi:hypothetical protein
MDNIKELINEVKIKLKELKNLSDTSKSYELDEYICKILFKIRHIKDNQKISRL